MILKFHKNGLKNSHELNSRRFWRAHQKIFLTNQSWSKRETIIFIKIYSKKLKSFSFLFSKSSGLNFDVNFIEISLFLFIIWIQGFEKGNFLCQEIFSINFDFKNGCKNEFEDNNEKSYSRSRKRVCHKIDFKAVWPHNGHAASVGVKLTK